MTSKTTNNRWTKGCEAQQTLEDLFKAKEIKRETMSGDVQKKYQIFLKFSPDVFRKHFSLTRQMFFTGGKTDFLLVYVCVC